MRTTVNIDDHLLAEAKVIAAREHRTIGSVLEDALRRLIEEHEQRGQSSEPYQLPTFEPTNPGYAPGVDPDDREQLYDLMYGDRISI